MWWCTIEKFDGSSGGFNTGFGETEDVRVVSIDNNNNNSPTISNAP